MNIPRCFTLDDYATVLDVLLAKDDLDTEKLRDLLAGMSVAMRETDRYSIYAVLTDFGKDALKVPTGWEIVAIRRRSDRPEENFLYAVLCHSTTDRYKWSTWSYNSSCNTFNLGHYWESWAEAFADWSIRDDFRFGGQDLFQSMKSSV